MTDVIDVTRPRTGIEFKSRLRDHLEFYENEPGIPAIQAHRTRVRRSRPLLERA